MWPPRRSCRCRALRIARHNQRTVADEPRAQQRRRGNVVVFVWNREAITLVGERVFGIAAVEVIAGEARVVAQVFVAARAVAAFAAGVAQPRHADAVADIEAFGRRAFFGDDADDFMPGNDRQLAVSEVAIDDVQIGAAHAAGANLDQQLIGRGLGKRQLREA